MEDEDFNSLALAIVETIIENCSDKAEALRLSALIAELIKVKYPKGK